MMRSRLFFRVLVCSVLSSGTACLAACGGDNTPPAQPVGGSAGSATAGNQGIITAGASPITGAGVGGAAPAAG
ncbi:MAG TPA: hypothetical protein VJV78_14665, partial [Polyangiales bacterium]|nr:hypothetical protein [Polyangiales bacterium]